MNKNQPPSDSRGTRAWLLAFQKGFKRTYVGVDLPDDDLTGLLRTADLRLLAQAAVAREAAREAD